MKFLDFLFLFMSGRINLKELRDLQILVLFHQHFHLRSANAFRVGRPFSSFIGPLLPDIRAQKERLRPLASLVLGLGAGGFRFDLVSLLIFSRPLAVKPPVRDLCTPIFRLTERVLLFVAFATFLASARSFTFVCHYQIPGII